LPLSLSLSLFPSLSLFLSLPLSLPPSLSPSIRKPSHPLLSSFIAHMGKDGQENWDASLTSLPRLPNHSACEMCELTQTGKSTNHGTAWAFIELCVGVCVCGV